MLHRLTGMGLTAEQVAEAALERLLAGQRKALPRCRWYPAGARAGTASRPA